MKKYCLINKHHYFYLKKFYLRWYIKIKQNIYLILQALFYKRKLSGIFQTYWKVCNSGMNRLVALIAMQEERKRCGVAWLIARPSVCVCCVVRNFYSLFGKRNVRFFRKDRTFWRENYVVVHPSCRRWRRWTDRIANGRR